MNLKCKSRERLHIPVRPLFLSIGQPSAERAADEDIPADGKESEVRVRCAEPIGRKGDRNGRRRIFQRTLQLRGGRISGIYGL